MVCCTQRDKVCCLYNVGNSMNSYGITQQKFYKLDIYATLKFVASTTYLILTNKSSDLYNLKIFNLASNTTPIEKQCIFWLITINYYVQIHLTVVSFFFFLCFKVSIYFMLMGRDISIIILQKKDACIDRLLKCANLP